MKKLSLIFVTILLMSCDSNVITQTDQLKYNYVVREISEYKYRGKCIYKLDTGWDLLGYTDEIYVIDSIGKFNVKDTVYINVIKK